MFTETAPGEPEQKLLRNADADAMQQDCAMRLWATASATSQQLLPRIHDEDHERGI